MYVEGSISEKISMLIMHHLFKTKNVWELHFLYIHKKRENKHVW